MKHVAKILAASIAVFVIACAFVLVWHVRSVSHKPTRLNRLMQLGCALSDYANVNGAAPPVARSDDNAPPHSWRVLILPFLGPRAAELYHQYDMATTWNSPMNISILGDMPPVFRMPGEPDGHVTHYWLLVFTGMAKTLVGELNEPIEPFVDRNGNHYLLVESHNAGVDWTEPRDLIYAGCASGQEHPQLVEMLGEDAMFIDRTLATGRVADIVLQTRQAVPPEESRGTQ
jgi:hypothetical protein